jgi:hypothetical protein
VAKLKTGTRVSLDMTTLTIMRILPREVDPLVYKMSLEDPGGATFAGIGGLGEQVRELREVCLRYHPMLFSSSNTHFLDYRAASAKPRTFRSGRHQTSERRPSLRTPRNGEDPFGTSSSSNTAHSFPQGRIVSHCRQIYW